MRRTILGISIIIILIFIGCGQKNGEGVNPKLNTISSAEEETQFHYTPREIATYFLDFSSSESKRLFVGRSEVKHINWSEDGKYFTFIEDKIDDNGMTVSMPLHLYNAMNLNEISLPDEVNDSRFFYKYAFWDNNENLIISKYNNAQDEWTNLAAYSIISKQYKPISEEQYKKYANIILNKEQQLLARYVNKDNLVAELKSKTGDEFSIGFISLDKRKFLYCTQNYEVFLYDIELKQKTFLFKGFNIQWSPGEKKVLYNLPKGKKLDELKVSANYQSEELESHVYNLLDNKSQKISDFCVSGVFSPDDKYLVYYNFPYYGLGEI